MDAAALPVLIAALEGVVNLLLLGALLLLLALHRQSVVRWWRGGLVVAGVVLLLAVPQHLSTFVYFDIGAMLGELGLPRLEWAVRLGSWAGLFLGLFASSLAAGWTALVYCVAVGEWSRLRPGTDVLAGRPPAPTSRLWIAAGAGALVGVAFSLLFHWLGVEAGQGLEQLQVYYPSLAEAGPLTKALTALPYVSSAALTEEIVFRGALLGFLLRAGKERGWVIVAATVVVSLLWASLHLSATDAPLLKFGQITLIGFALAELTRRWNLESAILAHLGLNLAGLATMVVVGS